MYKRIVVLFILVFVTFYMTACMSGVGNNNSDDKKPVNTNTDNPNITDNPNDTENTDVTPTPGNQQGDPVPTYNVDWPADMLPDDFPNLGKVTKVSDSRLLGNRITVYWNMITEDQMHELVDKLNDYLDIDHVWQDSFYSDGTKYKTGTQDEYIRIVIRYNDSNSGQIEPEFKPQFYLEISGEGLK